MMAYHTEWLLGVISRLGRDDEKVIIWICLFALDQTQYRMKQEYRPDEEDDIFNTLRKQEAVEGLQMKDIWMLKEPTLETLRSAINNAVKCGIAEPFLATSLYDLVSYTLDQYADPVLQSEGERNLKAMLEYTREHPAEFSSPDETDKHDEFTAHVEQKLAESAQQLAENQRRRNAWRDVVKDREGMRRTLGAWSDLLAQEVKNMRLPWG